MKALKKILLTVLLLVVSVKSAGAAVMGGLQETRNGIGYSDQTSAETALPEKIGHFINIAISMLGVVFMVLIWLGAFDILGAGGDEAQVKKGRDRIKNGAIGILIILAAFFITKLILFIVSNTGYFNSTP